MKRMYTPPAAEVVKFEYRDQIVAASGIIPDKCTTHRTKDIVSGSGDVCMEAGTQNA